MIGEGRLEDHRRRIAGGSAGGSGKASRVISRMKIGRMIERIGKRTGEDRQEGIRVRHGHFGKP